MRLDLIGGAGGPMLVGRTAASLIRGIATFSDVRIDRPANAVRLEATLVGHPHRVVSEPFDVVEEPDLIRVDDGTALPIAALVDGEGARGFVKDRPFLLTGSSIEVILGPSDESNEVVVFQGTRAPGVTTADWTTGVDTVDVHLLDPIRVPITVWVITGDFPAVRDAAEAAIAGANELFADERAGIEIGDVRVVDATDDPDAPMYRQGPFNEPDLFRDIGHDAGRINVYSVDSVVLGGEEVGAVASLGVGLIYIRQRSWTPEIFAHELGHNFSLGHAHDFEGFVDPAGNLMAPGLGPNLTEGQIFHMHFNTVSALNLDFGLRTSTQRLCANVVIDSQDPACVRVDMRVFPDRAVGAAVAPRGLRLPPDAVLRRPGDGGTVVGRLIR